MIKIDNRLKEALDKGFKAKQKAEAKMAEEKQAQREARELELKKQLPEARKWVDANLFDRIAKEEALGSHQLVLNEFAAHRIDIEAILIAVKSIDGLRAWIQYDVIWQDDYGEEYCKRLYIEWKSPDPNINILDR